LSVMALHISEAVRASLNSHERTIQLIDPASAPKIDGIASPSSFYWVLNETAPLAGMRLPSHGFPWDKIAAVGFRRVVSLHPGAYDPAPLSFIFRQKLQDLVSGGPPTDPAKEEQLIRTAVNATIQALRSGKGVVVHCVGGRGRTGTVIGCVLRQLGYDPKKTTEYLDGLHKLRGKPGWPESPWQARLVQEWSPE
jgi:Tyrosine phosphatase family